MGFVFSKSVNDSLEAQQEFMVMNSRLQVTHTPAAVWRKVTRGPLSAQSWACGFARCGLLPSQG